MGQAKAGSLGPEFFPSGGRCVLEKVLSMGCALFLTVVEGIRIYFQHSKS